METTVPEEISETPEAGACLVSMATKVSEAAAVYMQECIKLSLPAIIFFALHFLMTHVLQGGHSCQVEERSN